MNPFSLYQIFRKKMIAIIINSCDTFHSFASNQTEIVVGSMKQVYAWLNSQAVKIPKDKRFENTQKNLSTNALNSWWQVHIEWFKECNQSDLKLNFEVWDITNGKQL